MSELLTQLNETVAYIKSKVSITAKAGIVLGSGLGNLAEVIKTDVSIPYTDIPHFPVSTVKGHGGKLILAN